MQTNEERAARIRRRTRELKKQRSRRNARLIDAGCVLSSLILILLLALWIPNSFTVPDKAVAHTAMTASLIGSGAGSGYIVMGILSFLLGVCVTILLYRLHHYFHDKGDDSHEL